jgi:hypothetical protein
VRPFFDASRRIADDIFKHLAEFPQDVFHPFPGQGILVSCLRSSKDAEPLDTTIIDQRLAYRSLAMDDMDQVIDHAPFASHDEIQVAQAHIEIDEYRFLAA